MRNIMVTILKEDGETWVSYLSEKRLSEITDFIDKEQEKDIIEGT